ncbi:MAG TPA: CAP domain-containing protein [Blastocatellia bacterium]|nr:CAP domain-containing protein [Blastocatellia bacterium]
MSRSFVRCCVLVLSLALAVPAGAGTSESGKASEAKAAEAKSDAKTLQPVVFKADDLEERAFAAINRERLANGLPPLRYAPDLSNVARAHSQDMLTRDYFAHQSPDGKDLRYRFAKHGITNWRYIAENIAYNSGYEDPVAAAVEGWMHSPGHRKNILNRELTESGIGVAMSESGRIYFTQVFTVREEKTQTASLAGRR